MDQPKQDTSATARVERHRLKNAANGIKRVEVSVPSRDVPLFKEIAKILRTGGPDARRLRTSLEPLAPFSKAKNGAELVAFFRTSPLIDADLDVARDRSTGRSSDLD